jgi:hypothetical protein
MTYPQCSEFRARETITVRSGKRPRVIMQDSLHWLTNSSTNQANAGRYCLSPLGRGRIGDGVPFTLEQLQKYFVQLSAPVFPLVPEVPR